MSLTCVVGLILASPALGATAEQLAALDAQFARRGDPKELKALDEALTQALQQAPEDYELLWRLARVRHWQAEGAADLRLKKALGKQLWELGERGMKVRPEGIEALYYAALGIGVYSQAVGILKALSEGLESKYNERLDKVLAMNADHDTGGALLAKGRYFYELPWPKRDLKKSAEYYQKVADTHPKRLRAWYFLAETLLADGKGKEALEAIKKVQEGSVADDPPEGERVKEWSKSVRAKIEEEIK